MSNYVANFDDIKQKAFAAIRVEISNNEPDVATTKVCEIVNQLLMLKDGEIETISNLKAAEKINKILDEPSKPIS
ncbi:TPA: hypothetical protein U9B06_001123 [Streptococcus agalactiae]|uniref:hypothetical protein n=1 Tax=Streptococcus TaxID=1301 RepID=UPI0002BB9CE8|nr:MULTISPECIES: hypothetical protein [Streptococcus]EPV58750.1 hypothetical protein SAG0359_06995 [Streptococcus agalactiae GB00922]EPW04839.1 hypothetical protein SAG0046_01105 [Streptococcus agalactiae FSL S3-005]KAF1174149.1 hypothetical protein B8V21_06165 [Streptococcus agalactiae]MDK6305479.1 hypothetical protein [Streptococcus agalactiae]OFQ67461.1 hypothetical protein HMPREF2923_06985 [Streptococcus sp. HMSC078D02]